MPVLWGRKLRRNNKTDDSHTMMEPEMTAGAVNLDVTSLNP